MTAAPFDLFAVLHGNLGFSSIPVEDYPVVLDRCFWPVVEELSGGSGCGSGWSSPVPACSGLPGTTPRSSTRCAGCSTTAAPSWSGPG